MLHGSRGEENAAKSSKPTDHVPLISIVVVNWNGKAFLKDCLDSVLAQSYPTYEVIIVDNGSNDGSVEWLKSHYESQITVIENDRNYGYAKGANIGFTAVKGEFIALINNDTIATPQWLEELVDAALVDESVGMCACKVLFAHNTRLINSAGNLIYPDGVSARRGFNEVDAGQYDHFEETLFPDGSAALYRKQMVDELGGFDEQFFIYSEDADLGLRGWLFGWRCVYVPTAVIYHVHSGTMSHFSVRKAMLVERNRFWLVVKLFPWPLLLLSPIYTLNRFFWNTYGAVSGKGSAGRFCAQYSTFALLLVLVKAYFSGLRGLPAMIKKRREVMARKQLGDWDFIRLTRRFHVTAKEIALRER